MHYALPFNFSPHFILKNIKPSDNWKSKTMNTGVHFSLQSNSYMTGHVKASCMYVSNCLVAWFVAPQKSWRSGSTDNHTQSSQETIRSWDLHNSSRAHITQPAQPPSPLNSQGASRLTSLMLPCHLRKEKSMVKARWPGSPNCKGVEDITRRFINMLLMTSQTTPFLYSKM